MLEYACPSLVFLLFVFLFQVTGLFQTRDLFYFPDNGNKLPARPNYGGFMTSKYPFQAIEEKWRAYWQAIDLYQTGNEPGKAHYYILDFFPYPSGAGLSVGHCRNYVPTCVEARFRRMNGFNVLHPMGWDAFGLPAENFAIQHQVHPAITTQRHTDNYRRQLQLVECSYDWTREINSTDPAYYRWTQWFFLLLFQRGLAYQALGSQWWCPQCQTILANEQVESGRCWRCGSMVSKKELKQWYFKITDYAEQLLADLEGLDWPEAIKLMQQNWIGRSEGAEIVFQVPGRTAITTFTTRPDTLFGVTFLAIAPEYPNLEQLIAPAQREAVMDYVAAGRQQSSIEREAAGQEKTGVFSGSYAIHPVTGRDIPIWVADYVVGGYGRAAVMGVPAHDRRDFAFAGRYGLPIIPVVSRPEGENDVCFTGQGLLQNSGPYDGLGSLAGGQKMVADLQAQGLGQPAVSYKMRDWLISRQRYWGAPIPIVHCPTCGPVAVPERELPVLLPPMKDFAPAGDGLSPLARASEWLNTNCPTCGGPAKRETDTMDGFACSSWYFLRFASPHETERPFDPQAVRQWLPVDTYVGGAEHAVMHLLYARFWTKVMADAGLIDFGEPFHRLRNQGVLHAPDGRRMSKSKGNVITPDEVIATHGTDALRAYVVFMGPFEANVVWDTTGIRGITRFLDRFWQLAHDVATLRPESFTLPPAFKRWQHQTVKRISQEMAAFKYNTALAGLMEWLNYLTDVWPQGGDPAGWQEAIATFALLLAPIAPFISEEVWQGVLARPGSVHRQSWPTYQEALIVSEALTVVVQVNGKVRDNLKVPAGTPPPDLEQIALARPNIQRFIANQKIVKIVVVPDKIVNIVVN